MPSGLWCCCLTNSTTTMHHFPLCQTITRLQALGRVVLEVYEVLVCIFYFKHRLFCIHMIFLHFYLLLTALFRSRQCESMCASQKYLFVPNVYHPRTLCLNSSLFWLISMTVRNEQLTSRFPPQEHSTLSK